ncbi:MAG: hypothetical protein J0I98_18210 [Mesorhizobium sp.]|nr:hypothetical protein [Mesorhizobium sp.]
MPLECDERGDFVLDPALLCARLSLTEAELRRRMRLGQVTSQVEIGIGDDEGLSRLTVRSGSAVWRAVVDRTNEVVEEERIDL